MIHHPFERVTRVAHRSLSGVPMPHHGDGTGTQMNGPQR